MSKSYWKLTDEEYEFIKGEVIHIFEKYNIKCIPVSGFEIASKMKITLIAYSGLSKRKLKKAINWHLDILRLNIIILWCDIFICKDFLKDKSIQLIDLHDEWWDKVDYKLENYLHGAWSYLLREYVLWKRYFRSLHEGLD